VKIIELKALVSLLDDSDKENLQLVEGKIRSLGEKVIPFLEDEWDISSNPDVQNKIEDLIHSVQFSSLKEKFRIWKQKKLPDVLEGMFLCAKYNYPNLDLAEIEKKIKKLALDATEFHDDSLHPYDQVRALNRFIFTKNRFKPNRKKFHNPSNSYLNVVLESRLGNPLSLAVIYMLIAHQLGMPVYGVNFPNLFILTFKGVDLQFYINVYNSGLIFTTADVDDYLKQLKLKKEKKFYQPCLESEIIARNLRNLIHSYKEEKNEMRVQEIEELLSIIGE